jgi:hypothetical protein
VHGLYEGTCRDARGELKIEARVVAQGNGTYKVLVRKIAGDGKISRVELKGTTDGDAVNFNGRDCDVEWKCCYTSGTITGTCGEGCKLDVKRVERVSPTMGKKPPQGAVLLFEGKTSMDEMVRANGSPWYVSDKSRDGWAVWEVPIRTIVANDPSEWPSRENIIPKDWVLGGERRRVDTVRGIADDGSMQVPGGGMNSKRQFEGNFDYHVEFMCPLVPAAHSQGRGNSGVYLPNGDEIQVLDSFGETTYEGGGCGGFYKYKNPDTMDVIESIKNNPENKYTLASTPPLQWQTYDIEYRVKKQDGKYAGKPCVTVYHNGIKIHDNVQIQKDAKKGHFHFQDHGNPVRYRNIWVLPLEEK